MVSFALYSQTKSWGHITKLQGKHMDAERTLIMASIPLIHHDT
jgi:hypothetical protein